MKDNDLIHEDRMMTFTKENLKTIREDIDIALKQVAIHYGISLAIGNISFTANDFSTKLTASCTTDSDQKSSKQLKWEKDFRDYAFSLGFSPDDLGKEVFINGKLCTIAGARPRAKDPVIVKTPDGKFLICSSSLVKNAL